MHIRGFAVRGQAEPLKTAKDRSELQGVEWFPLKSGMFFSQTVIGPRRVDHSVGQHRTPAAVGTVASTVAVS